MATVAGGLGGHAAPAHYTGKLIITIVWVG